MNIKNGFLVSISLQLYIFYSPVGSRWIQYSRGVFFLEVLQCNKQRKQKVHNQNNLGGKSLNNKESKSAGGASQLASETPAMKTLLRQQIGTNFLLSTHMMQLNLLISNNKLANMTKERSLLMKTTMILEMT